MAVPNSLSEKRYNDRWNGILDAAGSSTSATMVHNGSHPWKQPLVGAVPNVIDIFSGLTSEV